MNAKQATSGPAHAAGPPRVLVAALLTAAAIATTAPRPAAALTVYEKEDFSLGIALRMQPRVELTRSTSGTVRDFMVRRSRLGISGKTKKVQYRLEWKIDGTDQIGATPAAAVENAYLQYPLGNGVELRAGLYDVPFSRDRLTSDSKQLAVDRGAVSGLPDGFGLADNVTGFHVIGKVDGGRAEYALGLFDNRTIAGQFQDVPMVAGRLDLNLGATQDVLWSTHFGDKSWYSVGLNGNYQGRIQDATGADQGYRGAAGIDGMVDVPAWSGRVIVIGEANLVTIRPPTGGGALQHKAWMLGLGWLTWKERLQPIVRFDETRVETAGGEVLTGVMIVGANLYQQGHGLKLQGDLRFQSGTGEALDGGRLQAQIDF